MGNEQNGKGVMGRLKQVDHPKTFGFGGASKISAGSDEVSAARPMVAPDQGCR